MEDFMFGYCTLTILESEKELSILEERLNISKVNYYIKPNTSLSTFSNHKVMYEVMVKKNDLEKSRHSLFCRND